MSSWQAYPRFRHRRSPLVHTRPASSTVLIRSGKGNLAGNERANGTYLVRDCCIGGTVRTYISFSRSASQSAGEFTPSLTRQVAHGSPKPMNYYLLCTSTIRLGRKTLAAYWWAAAPRTNERRTNGKLLVAYVRSGDLAACRPAQARAGFPRTPFPLHPRSKIKIKN